MFFERLALATGNRGKHAEFAAMLPRTLVGELVFAPDRVPSVEETGTTYAENALLKARAWAEALDLPSLADDSGLEVDALGGAPGVHSARVVPGSDGDRNRWLLERLRGREDRGARFVAALALYVPRTSEGPWSLVCEGNCPGRIAETPTGTGGFGYDPLFLPDGYEGVSFAALPASTKNVISHRAAALRLLVEILSGTGQALSST